MNGVIAHFVRRDLRFEVEGPKTAVPAANCIEFWIEIKDARARKIDNPKVRITGALRFPQDAPPRDRSSIQVVFSVPTPLERRYFVDPRYAVDRIFWRVHSFHRLAKAAALFNMLIDAPDRHTTCFPSWQRSLRRTNAA
jgi:hypothetical protein